MAKVLVIDDDEAILDAVCMLLEDVGYEVRTTPKGNETFEKVNQFNPDIILLDVLMSGSDGREIAKKLKENERTKKIPIVMISAHPSAETGAKESGVEGFLPKPFDSNELLKVVQKFLPSNSKKSYN